MDKKYVVSYSLKFLWLIDAPNPRTAIEEVKERASGPFASPLTEGDLPVEWEGLNASKIRAELQKE